MKRWQRWTGLFGAVALLGAGCATESAYDQPGVYGGTSVSIGVFYDALSPYGAWIASGRWGRVWRPYVQVVGPGFVPYATGGHWIYTDFGWTWDSDFDWGWAPFHYGEWFLDPYYGWVWIPGNVWGPAWVDWRYGNGFVGWAPLPPPGFALGFGSYWSFVPVDAFCYRDPIHYAVPVNQLQRPWGLTEPVHRTVVHGGVHLPAGPPPNDVARAGVTVATGQVMPPPPGTVAPVRPVRVQNVPQVAPGPRVYGPREGQPGQPVYRPPNVAPPPGGPPTYQPPAVTNAPPGYQPPAATPPPGGPPAYQPPSVSPPPSVPPGPPPVHPGPTVSPGPPPGGHSSVLPNMPNAPPNPRPVPPESRPLPTLAREGESVVAPPAGAEARASQEERVAEPRPEPQQQTRQVEHPTRQVPPAHHAHPPVRHRS